MTAWLRPLWRPTLLRRVLGALLVAFLLVAAVLVLQSFAEFKQEVAERPAVQTLADGIATSLAPLAAARDVGLVVQARAHELNQLRHQSGMLAGDVEFSVRDAEGRPVFATPGAAGATPATHWMASASAGRWRLTLAEPRLGDATVLAWLGRDLVGSLLLAFPLVLLPLWLAVRRGMRPLNMLAETVARRDAHDLSPLGFTPLHDELKPLATAFDDLLARLRAQLQRERAFVQDAAHELRTPMAVVAAQAHLLAHASDAAGRERAGLALDQALQRAAHLSRQLLTLARLDDRSDTAEPLDLADLVQQLLAQLAPQALARGLALSLEAPPALAARLDRAAFESVVLNLVDNALRYVQSGGHVAVTLAADGAQVTLRVADDGPGIPPAHREAAFERFWRGGDSGGTTGSGLGLAIVRQAARRLGGTVRIEPGLGGRGCGVVLMFDRADWPISRQFQ